MSDVSASTWQLVFTNILVGFLYKTDFKTSQALPQYQNHWLARPLENNGNTGLYKGLALAGGECCHDKNQLDALVVTRRREADEKPVSRSLDFVHYSLSLKA